MNRNIISILIVLICAPFLGMGQGGSRLTDPLEILNRHYEAIGGVEALKAETTSYLEAQFVLVGTGLEGTLKQWNSAPVKTRQELDLKILTQISGDDGQVAWQVDTNGQLKVLRDEETVKARELRRLMAEYAHLDPDSPHFKMTFKGIEQVDGKDCYRVGLANNITLSQSDYYINCSTFLMEKTVELQTSGNESHTTFADYRPVGGILHPFRQTSQTVPTHQTQEVIVKSMETGLEIDAALYQPPEQQGDDFHFTNGTSAVNVPFQFYEDHIYLYVTINCDKQLWVLDSGASMTVIDKGYAERLGLELEGNLTGQGVNNTMEIAFVTLPGLRVEGIEFDEQRGAALDLAPLFEQLGDLEVAGILGYDFMSRFVTRIDYANETLSFYHPDHFVYEGSGRVIETPVNESNMFTMPMTVEGRYAGQWRVDTGANITAFHFDYTESNGFLERPGVERQSFGAGGSHVSRQVMFSGAELGGFQLPPVVISVPLQRGHGAMAEKALIGNIGSNIFRHFVVYFDYQRQQMILEKGDDFGRAFPLDKSGLQVWYPGGEKRVEIRFIAPGTPAEKAGLKVDDRLLAVNGIPVEQLKGLAAIKELLRADAGTVYDLSVLRAGEVISFTLTLEDLFSGK